MRYLTFILIHICRIAVNAAMWPKLLQNPDGDNHQNIRNFMTFGWDGIRFQGYVLERRPVYWLRRENYEGRFPPFNIFPSKNTALGLGELAPPTNGKIFTMLGITHPNLSCYLFWISIVVSASFLKSGDLKRGSFSSKQR